MNQHVKHSDTASMADIQVKLPSHLVSDEVRRRVEAHKVYRTEVGAALNTALEVATALMDAEDFDAESLKEMDSIASEWHDMDQQVLLDQHFTPILLPPRTSSLPNISFSVSLQF
jgi:hypothetical protein